MSEGNPSHNPERKPIKMSYAEWQFISSEGGATDDFFGKSEIRGLLNRYNIELNSGKVEVEIDGKKHLMDTDEKNFGAIDPFPEPPAIPN